MKRSTFFKVALTACAAFVMTSAMAQTHPTNIQHTGDAVDYVQVGAAVNTVQTSGLGMTLYVGPDRSYSPNYDGTGVRGHNVNNTSEWRWVHGTTFAGGAQVKDWKAQENYVVLATGDLPTATGATTSATRVFWVAERINNSCADNTGVSHTVEIIGTPSATMVGANTSTNWGGSGTAFVSCGNVTSDNLTLALVEHASHYNSNWACVITVERQRVDANGTLTGVVETLASIGSIPTTSAGYTALTSVGTGTMSYLQTGTNNDRTRYTFTLTQVASHTSHLSHIRAGVANAAYTLVSPPTVTYTLNLPPVTGPIYHIPNHNF